MFPEPCSSQCSVRTCWLSALIPPGTRPPDIVLRRAAVLSSWDGRQTPGGQGGWGSAGARAACGALSRLCQLRAAELMDPSSLTCQVRLDPGAAAQLFPISQLGFSPSLHSAPLLLLWILQLPGTSPPFAVGQRDLMLRLARPGSAPPWTQFSVNVWIGGEEAEDFPKENRVPSPEDGGHCWTGGNSSAHRRTS